MARTWLIVDCPFICYRSLYSTGDLAHNGEVTGVTFGFMRDITTFQALFGTQDIIFCFDSRNSKRQGLWPRYKAGRRATEAALSDIDRTKKQEMRDQILKLRREYLPAIGYGNVFHADGYESDDIIASVCQTLPREDEKVIIGSDQDLWQCLGPHVCMYNPNGGHTATEIKFRGEWWLEPDQWADVKALAGCASDSVTGISGVGEKTAAKYLRGELCKSYISYKKIACPEGQKTWRRNLRLVRLPFADTPRFTVAPDTVTAAKWYAVADSLGFASLRDTVPVGGLKRARFS